MAFGSLKSSHFTLAVLAMALVAGCSEANFSPITKNSLTLGSKAEDNFIQGFTRNELDVLVVVDNSASMASEQQKLGARISSFLSTLSDVDWRIGITTTDLSSGTYGIKGSLLPVNSRGDKYITRATPDYLNAFLNTVVRPESYQCDVVFGECPSGWEEPLGATVQAMLKRDGDNAGFFRPTANLSVVVLTDEEELSRGGSGATTPQKVINTFHNIWGTDKVITGYGIIVKPGDYLCLAQQGDDGAFGNFVDSFARLTGGIVGSICDTDYGSALSKVGQSVRKLLDYVQLRAVPKDGTVDIQFTPNHRTEFQLRDKRVYFKTPPPEGTQIKVIYQVGG